MKKLALAPAVALAITGLAASPVMAAPETPAAADTQPAQTGALKAQAGKADKQAEEEPSVKLSKNTVSQADFGDSEKGVDIEAAGLQADHDYNITVSPTGDQNVENLETTATTNADGSFSHKIYGADDPAFVGTYSVVVNDSEDSNISFQLTFEVTSSDDSEEPEAPEVDPKVSIDTKEISVSEFEKNGLKLTGGGFTPGAKVNVFGNATQSPFFDTQVEADEDGKISATVEAPEDGLEPDTYSVSAVDAETETVSNYVNFELTADETEDPTTPAAEAKLTVSPETVSPADFVEKDKGVTLAVENCEPGEDVHYVVNPKGNSNVTAYDNTVKADDEGKASVNVYGTSASDADAYIGDYEVTVTCGDAELNGEFSVSDDANAGGSDGNEDGNGDGGNGGSDLPRTGTELTGLVGGGALLLIGGAAVAMTMRRKKVAQDPSQI